MPAQPTLKQLEALVAVAETGLFRLASEKLNVSQPALSEQIAQLEHRLGARLFDRDRRGARLTPVGERLAERARRILADVRGLEAVVRSAADNLGGLIRLGALPTLGPYLMPHVVPVLHARFPDLHLYVREAAGGALEDGVRSGQYDVALSVRPYRPEGLSVLPLVEERLFLGLARDDAGAGAKSASLNTLRGRDVLTLEHGHRLSELVRTLARDAGARLLEDYQGNSLDGLRQMVGMGLGVSLFPALYVRSEFRDDSGVIAVPFDRPDTRRQVVLMWREDSPREDDFRQLAAVIRERAEGLIASLD